MKNVFLWAVMLLCLILRAESDISAQQSGNSQNAVQPDKLASKPEKARPGTYQFISKIPGNQEAFTNDILITIERLRSDDQEVWMDLTENTKVRILPRSVINRAEFKPLNENAGGR